MNGVYKHPDTCNMWPMVKDFLKLGFVFFFHKYDKTSFEPFAYNF